MGTVTLECTRCGDKYERHESQAENSKYCSMSCKAKSTIAKKKQVEITCGNCDDLFTVQKHRSETARFCSNECRAEWQSEAFRGTNGPGYKDGSAKLYEDSIQKKDWHELAESIRRRDKYECRSCAMTNAESLTEYNQILDVHHIKKPSEFNDFSDSHTSHNLITLCKRCHALLERNDMKTSELIKDQQ